MPQERTTVDVHYFGNTSATDVIIQLVDDHDFSLIEQEITHIKKLTGRNDFLLVAAKADNWNDDLSPWEAPAIFGNEGFGGNAATTLDALMSDVIVPLCDVCEAPRTLYLGGYSLAGLFALWSAYQTDIFVSVAAVSPSVWFTDFQEFATSHDCLAQRVYLSLGKKEEKTRSKTMAQVGSAIRAIQSDLNTKSIPCVLEWNDGNHFTDPDLRTAKGFAWLLNTTSSTTKH